MKVSVVMITYGQEEYIQQAVEGVLMQECNFGIQLIVVNDCSPDQTDKIIKKIISSHPRGNLVNNILHKTNKGTMSNFIWALSQVNSEYLAFCDGDDYWTDPYKLQKQIDFLDQNPSYSLVCSNFSSLYSSGLLVENCVKLNEDYDISFKDVILNRHISTLTAVFRGEFIDQILDVLNVIHKNNWRIGDFPIWSVIAQKSKIRYLNFNVGNYRVLSDSVSGRGTIEKQLAFNDTVINISKYLLNRFNAERCILSNMLEFRFEFMFNKIIEFGRWDYFNSYFARLKLEKVSFLFFIKMKTKYLNLALRKHLKAIFNG